MRTIKFAALPLTSIICAILSWASIAQAATLYVDANSTSAVPPYSSSATAASNITDAVMLAVNKCGSGGGWYLLSSGRNSGH